MHMNLRKLADEAADIMSYDFHSLEHGMEVAPGFFNVYNQHSGQCKAVLYHPASDYVFKAHHDSLITERHSGRYVGEVVLDNIPYKVRLPKFQVFDGVIAQEYIRGNNCGCFSSWCEHAAAMSTATRCPDTHTGNWKIIGHEIVLFDFEGIRL